MTFNEVLSQTIAMLQQHGRVSYRALKRQFALDDASLEDLTYELTEVQHCAVDHDGTIALSKQTIGGDHPAVWSIDPPAGKDAPLAVYTTDLGHKSLIVEVGKLKFGIVLIGRIRT